MRKEHKVCIILWMHCFADTIEPENTLLNRSCAWQTWMFTITGLFILSVAYTLTTSNRSEWKFNSKWICIIFNKNQTTLANASKYEHLLHWQNVSICFKFLCFTSNPSSRCHKVVREPDPVVGPSVVSIRKWRWSGCVQVMVQQKRNSRTKPNKEPRLYEPEQQLTFLHRSNNRWGEWSRPLSWTSIRAVRTIITE